MTNLHEVTNFHEAANLHEVTNLHGITNEESGWFCDWEVQNADNLSNTLSQVIDGDLAAVNKTIAAIRHKINILDLASAYTQ